MTKSRRSMVPLAVAVVAVDQASKHWAVNSLGDGRIVHVVWTLRLALGFNKGMAFSKATGLGPFIGIIAMVVVVWLLSALRRSGSTLSALGMALVAGGAAGNVVDRLLRGDGWFRGSVVDFIDLQWWPVFNIADSAITVGGCLLVLGAFTASRSHGEAGSPA